MCVLCNIGDIPHWWFDSLSVHVYVLASVWALEHVLDLNALHVWQLYFVHLLLHWVSVVCGVSG